MGALARDAAHALRLARRAPAFSLVVVAVLALGIGVNSAMFTLVDTLLFRPLSGRASELVGVYSHDPAVPDSYRLFSYPNYADLERRHDVFERLIAYTFAEAGLPDGDLTKSTRVAVVSSNFFDAIGVRLAAGRPFSLEEERPRADVPVAIAAYPSWRASGFDPAFIGRTIRLNTRDFTIVGVAPEGFTGTSALFTVGAWVPLGVFDSIVTETFKNNGGGLADRSDASLNVAGLLRAGLTLDQADAQLAVASADLERADPVVNRNQRLSVQPLSRVTNSVGPASDAGPTALSAVLLPLAAAVLLIACLDLTNMLLARGTARRKEIAVRMALGAGRGRIVRQLLVESLVLGLVGAAAGLAIGAWVTRLFVTSVAPILPFPLQLDWRPDRNIVLATVAFGLLSTMAFGLAPALTLSRPHLLENLKDLGGGRSPGRRLGPRSWLVTGQIALSLMLMTAGGLFARAAITAAATSPGYRYDGLLLVSINPSLAGFDAATGRARVQGALDRVRQLPGVQAAGASSQVPFGDEYQARAVGRPGRSERPFATYTVATSDYFNALALPILIGRDFTRGEARSASGPGVAIIDEPLARRLFPDESPIGQAIVFPPRAAEAPAVAPMTIVGVVPGIRDEITERELAPHVYVPSTSDRAGTTHFTVRVAPGSEAQLAAAIRGELRAFDDRLPIVRLSTMREFHERGLVLWVVRAAGRALSGLGGLALLLAAIGVYGVKSYVVSARTREIGIRLALGATNRDIVGMLLRDGARMTLVGLAIGFPLAVGLGVLLSAVIFEVHPFDPVVLTLAPLVLAASAAAAAYLPARRGMRVSPLESLRAE